MQKIMRKIMRSTKFSKLCGKLYGTMRKYADLCRIMQNDAIMRNYAEIMQIAQFTPLGDVMTNDEQNKGVACFLVAGEKECTERFKCAI